MKESHLKIAVAVLAACLLLTLIVGVALHQQQKTFEEGKVSYFKDIDWIFPEYEELVAESELIVVAKVTDGKGIWEQGIHQKKPLFEFHLKNPWRDKESVVSNSFIISIGNIFYLSILTKGEEIPPFDPAFVIGTIYKFEPVTVLKGNTSEFKGHMFGGTFEDYSCITNHTYTSFEDGDIVLLFLGHPWAPTFFAVRQASDKNDTRNFRHCCIK
jgi:hypothetical protein